MTNIPNGNLELYIKKLISDVLDGNIQDRYLPTDNDVRSGGHEVPGEIMKERKTV